MKQPSIEPSPTTGHSEEQPISKPTSSKGHYSSTTITRKLEKRKNLRFNPYSTGKIAFSHQCDNKLNLTSIVDRNASKKVNMASNFRTKGIKRAFGFEEYPAKFFGEREKAIITKSVKDNMINFQTLMNEGVVESKPITFLNIDMKYGLLIFDCDNVATAEWLETMQQMCDWKKLGMKANIIYKEPTLFPKIKTYNVFVPPATTLDDAKKYLAPRAAFDSSNWIVLHEDKTNDRGTKYIITTEDETLKEIVRHSTNPVVDQISYRYTTDSSFITIKYNLNEDEQGKRTSTQKSSNNSFSFSFLFLSIFYAHSTSVN